MSYNLMKLLTAYEWVKLMKCVVMRMIYTHSHKLIISQIHTVLIAHLPCTCTFRVFISRSFSPTTETQLSQTLYDLERFICKCANVSRKTLCRDVTSIFPRNSTQFDAIRRTSKQIQRNSTWFVQKALNCVPARRIVPNGVKLRWIMNKTLNWC